MGQGIKLGTPDPILAKALEDMRDQLLLVLIKRGGGSVTIPVSEIDGTGGYVCNMTIEGEGATTAFRFDLSKKH